MIDKGEVIKTAFFRLGKNNAYNDNKSDEYTTAVALLDKIIDNMAKQTAFLFNSVTTKLTSTGANDMGENRFNTPVDCLNIIRADNNYREENEFIYSSSSELNIQYCRKIDVKEYPDKLFDYMVASLCKDMCLAFNAYQDRFQLFSQDEYKERSKIINQQGFNYNPWG